MLTPYPFERFALVENFWDTGYGIPGFTLLGPQVIRFPWVLRSSCPHEILHSWWGNSASVSEDGGNWSEGLTAATEAVGYGKSLMFWHMIRRHIGEEAFLKGLSDFQHAYSFKAAGFADREPFLSESSGEDLSEFFQVWTTETGAVQLELSDVELRETEDGCNVAKAVWPVTRSLLSVGFVEGPLAEASLGPRRPQLAQMPPRFDSDALLAEATWFAAPERMGRGLGSSGMLQATDRVVSELESIGIAVERQIWTESVEREEVELVNVVATIPGSGCSLTSVVVLAGHGRGGRAASKCRRQRIGSGGGVGAGHGRSPCRQRCRSAGIR